MRFGPPWNKECSYVRVLFNTYPVAFDCPGGGEIQLLRSRETLENLGHEVALFDPWRPQLREVDLVHYFSVQGGSMNFCDYVKKLGLPLVISPVLWLTAENELYFPLDEIRDLLQLADRILPNSAAEVDQLSDRFHVPRHKFTIVPNGVDADFGRKVDGRLFCQRFGYSRPFVLNVANIEERKNQHQLCRAVKELGIDLALVGSVRDRQYLELCLRESGGHARYLGYIDHADDLLKSAYQACAVFALPSLLETPGLAALEAAAQGAKIVITDVGSPTEYFDEHVSYVDPLDPASIVTALERELATTRDASLQSHVLEHFTWRHAGQALRAAYELAIHDRVAWAA